MGKKLIVHSEIVYIFAIVILSFSVAMITTTDFGVSMIVAPAYILSQKLTFLTFGQSEYVLQAVLFIIFCLLMRKVKLSYFSSFLTCIIYGAVLDLWRVIVPAFNPQITPPGTMSMPIRIIFFVIGTVLTSLSIAMFYRTYLYPQVYDFFVKGISARFNIDRTKFKIGFDTTFLIIATVMSLVLFKGFVGIGLGTLIMTAFNGLMIGAFGRLIDRYVEITPLFEKFSKHFEL